ncbi:hypothetical protein ASG40_11475 [Methylobacterium sp. Leaf399]|uniref:hypothetical protein n=1 Tax=Methylobacterium sp. Leaf399 TaxID=1736364 RepID=UPI0006F8E3A8|nr:hypothetical protein [Methylobacterium sp. Leaf399]KQT08494.1 hypothetical protein ASG40_11475 [Methylobacterium sp. Leaf399]
MTAPTDDLRDAVDLPTQALDALEYPESDVLRPARELGARAIRTLLADLTKLKAERDEAVKCAEAICNSYAQENQQLSARALAAEAHRDALAAEVEGMRAALDLIVGEAERYTCFRSGDPHAPDEAVLSVSVPLGLARKLAAAPTPSDPERVRHDGDGWPASYQETFDAIGKAVTVHPDGMIGISFKAFYRALSYPDAPPPAPVTAPQAEEGS